MSYTEFKFGYAKESVFRTSVIDDVGDTAYKLGAFADAAKHPSASYDAIPIGPGYNSLEVAAGMMFETSAEMRGFYTLIVQNGIPCWMALGKSATTGTDPYTHTITPYTDGTLLPSFTINVEDEGTATDEEFQWTGCKVDSLVLSHDAKTANILTAKMEWMAGKEADGIALTTAPQLPPTANTDPYIQLERKYDISGDNLDMDGLQRVDIVIQNGLEPLQAHTTDAGTYTGEWTYQFLEANMKGYEIQMLLHPSTVERKIWDDKRNHTNTKDYTFKWTRSANDYIKVTATNCHVLEHEKITPKAGELMLLIVRLKPEQLSIEVKDSIAGGLYGG